MKKVYITKVIKGKDPFNAVGMFDLDAKKLFVPRVSKNGMPYIDIVDIDYVSNSKNGYRCEVIIEIDDRHFMDVYYINPLD